MDTKGIETVRRDNCLLVRQVIETVLEKDFEAARRAGRGEVRAEARFRRLADEQSSISRSS